MFFTKHRRSERIRNRNVPAHNRMLRQTKRNGARVPASVVLVMEINKLPDELVVQILSRLPPKSFFRCRSVCKTWLSLSSDAVCLNKHLLPTMSGFFYNKVRTIGFGAGFVKFSCGINEVEVDGMISTLSFQEHLQILDSCNGLLLVEAYNSKSRFAFDITKDVHVYNPVTRTLFTLWSHKLDDQVFSLAFDPQVFNQFHVIRFTDGLDSKVNFLDIFSYEKGKCKHRKRLVSDVRIYQYSKSTFIDGRVNRLTTQDEILSIDPNNCSYEVIRPPNLENRDLIEIGQSQGVLHCMSICSEKMLFIWVLESYTRQEWTLKYQLSIDAIYPVPIRNLDEFRIHRIQSYEHFAFHPEKDVLFMSARNESFVSLDLITGKGEKLKSFVSLDYCWVYTPSYLV